MTDFARLAEAVAFHRKVSSQELELVVLMEKHPEFKANLEAGQVHFTEPFEVCEGLVLRGIFCTEEVLRGIWERSNAQLKEPVV